MIYNFSAIIFFTQAIAPGYARPTGDEYDSKYLYLYEPSTSHFTKPLYSPSKSYLQITPVYDEIEPGQDQTLELNLVLPDASADTPDIEVMVRIRGWLENTP